MSSQSIKSFSGEITEGNSKTIPKENCVRMVNMICLENKFLTRSGYKKFNSVPYSGHINLIYEFHRIAGGTLNITAFGNSLFVGTPTYTSAPVANAGVDQIDVNFGSTVTLDGSASTDVTSYLWTQTSGTTVTLSDATAEKPTFTMPASDVEFSLKVTNFRGDDTDTVDVANSLVLPVASAGADQSKDTGDTVTLDGSASTDVTSYLWTQTSGTTVTLSDATAEKPTFTMPSGDVTFSLKVTNFRGDDTDTVDIANTVVWIEIYDVDDLQAMQDDLTGSYILMNDIDASATTGWNAGAGFAPVGTFTGIFDGDGHTITDLFINRLTPHTGLFGRTNNAEIKNIGLIDVDITGGDNLGSLVGYNFHSSITNCYATGSVTSSGSAYYDIGGLIGENLSIITNCYSTCAVSGGNRMGGLIGLNQGGTYNDCFWDTQTSGQATSNGGTGKTTAEMKQEATFSGWDFSTIWAIVEGVSYPTLR